MSLPHKRTPVLSASSLELFSAVELAAAGSTAALCLLSAAFVAYVAFYARRTPCVSPFTALWGPRLVLHGCGCGCLGAMLLRLPAWWAIPQAWVGTRVWAQGLLCRLSLCLAYGAFLPLLTALALCVVALPRHALLPCDGGEGAPRRRTRSGAQLVLLAVAAATPFAAAQTLIAFHDQTFGHRGGLRRRLGARWLDATAPAAPGSCPEETPDCLLCSVPLLSAACSALAALLFGAAQLWHCRQLARAAVSRRLAVRASWLGRLLALAPLVSAALRGTATLSAPPQLLFQLLMAADFAAVALALGAAVAALSVLPSLEAATAGAAVGWGAGAAAAEGGAHTLLRPLLGGGGSEPGSTGSGGPASSMETPAPSSTGRRAGGPGSAGRPATPGSNDSLRIASGRRSSSGASGIGTPLPSRIPNAPASAPLALAARLSPYS